MENETNLTCRIFKEHIDLLDQFPEQEKYEIFYKSIQFAFNQIENQIDSINVSDSTSALGKSVFNLLKKSIICKKISANYGGKRENAGRKTNNIPVAAPAPKVIKPENPFASLTEDLIIRAALEKPDSALSVFLETGAGYDELSAGEREFVDRPDVRKKCPWYKEKQATPVKRKPFVPPTIDEWLEYCREKNLDMAKMRNAYESYMVADWHDSQGTPIRNWKQKILQVWCAKPQNYNQQTANFGAQSEINKLANGAELAKQMLKKQGIIQ